MPFKSSNPDIDCGSSCLSIYLLTDNLCAVPTDITIWDWLFDSPHSPLGKYSPRDLSGYTNAITQERIDYAQVKEHATHLSTALVKRYGLKRGQTVALFSPNTIWYPVAMLASLRAGTLLGALLAIRWLMTILVTRRCCLWSFASIQHRRNDLCSQDGGR